MDLERVSEQLYIVTELRGSYPDLKLPVDIDMDGLAIDLGFRPKLVTLPVGRVDGVSNNGRIYTEQAVRDLVDVVNRERLEGAWGHMRDEDRPYVYVPPAIRWVYAELIDGTAWGLGIPLDDETDKYFRAAARMNAKVGTSVYGLGNARGNKVTEFKGAEKIDIADPTRVGIPETAAIPKISEQDGSQMDKITINDVPEAVRQQILEQHNSKQDGERISEMQTQISELQGQISTLTTERDAARGEASKLLVTYAKATIAEQVQLEPVRKLVERMVGIREQENGAVINVSTVAEVDAVVKSVLEDEAVKEFNVDTLKEMMGPNINPPLGDKTSGKKSVLGDVIPG